MKAKICNIRYSKILAISLIIAITQQKTLAIIRNNHKIIYINSVQQSLDIVTNTITFIDKVMIKRGDITIFADKVVINRPDCKKDKEILEGYGNPITFYQIKKNGKSVFGHSQKVRYEFAKDLLILIDNAYIKQLYSNIKSDQIKYFVKNQQIEAFGENGKQVTTILMPTH